MITAVCDENITSMVKEYDIKSFEVNANNEIKPFVLLHYLEDMAYIHAENFHFGYTDIYPRGYAWFVLKYHMKFNKLPKSWDKIQIMTWPAINKGIQCRREFEIYDDKDVKIGAVTSIWVLIDINNQRIANPHKALNFPPLAEQYALNSSFEKIPVVNCVDFEKVFEIQFNDIDLNQHVNNSNYVAWATATMPYEFLSSNSISELEINYKKEAKYGMSILSQVEYNKATNRTIHSFKDKNTGEYLSGVKIIWKTH